MILTLILAWSLSAQPLPHTGALTAGGGQGGPIKTKRITPKPPKPPGKIP